MSDALTTTRPKKAKRLRKIDAAMRARIEQAIQSMIDTLDALEAPTEDLEAEDDGSDDEQEGDGDPDDEPSLGSLDRRMNQTKWSRPDYTPRGCWGLVTDAEYDGADSEGGIEDEPHDGDTDVDGCPALDGVPSMHGGDDTGDLVRKGW